MLVSNDLLHYDWENILLELRLLIFKFLGNIPIDGIDDEVDQLNRAAAQPGTYVVARKTTSPGPYNRSMSPQHSQYYMANQQATSQKLSRMQTLARYVLLLLNISQI